MESRAIVFAPKIDQENKDIPPPQDKLERPKVDVLHQVQMNV